ncbi:BON domain-containing protein [Pelagibacteraceae bacterium]|nr:BON domain-containing protein [Pelagibacteraceae bacterium]
MIKIIKIKYILVIIAMLTLTSCSQVVIGGATSAGLVLVQERSTKQAALDIIIKTKIEESMFSNSYDKLFSKVRVIVYEGKVLLVGTVEDKGTSIEAEEISWKTKNVKEVANYISVGKNDLVDYVKDTRISLEFRTKLLTDQEISEVNFSSTTENRILYIVGIAQDEKEMIKILDHASSIAGVKKIVNLIIKKNDPKRKK